MDEASEQELKLVFNVPNTVTAVRVVLAGVIVWLLWQHLFLAAGILIIVAASTDWLDGFLARRLGQETPGGVIFDLAADEIFFMPSLILAIVAGVFSKTDSLMPWNPYPYAVLALAGEWRYWRVWARTCGNVALERLSFPVPRGWPRSTSRFGWRRWS